MSIIDKVNAEDEILGMIIELVDNRDYRRALNYYNSLEEDKREYLENHKSSVWKVKILKKRGGRRF